MKRRIVLLAMVAMLLLCFVGCGNNAQTASLELADNGDGTLTVLDTATSPLDGGLNITVDQNQGFVNFQITDKNGSDTVEFYQFKSAEALCHRYKYVSMMGTGFNYFYDYNAGELVRIEDMDNADVTAKTKEQGRFDGAQTETKEAVDKLVAYFSDSFGMTIDEAVKGAE